jgi:hypothetical protein
MSKFRPYGSAATREVRRIRILAMIRDGLGFDEIAHRERISRERVRQIVGETLRRDDVGKDEHWRVQSARLEPALRLALDAVEEGRVEAIDRLIRVLAAQDKYRAQAPYADGREDVRQRLIDKINQAANESLAEIEAEIEAPPTVPATP